MSPAQTLIIVSYPFGSQSNDTHTAIALWGKSHGGGEGQLSPLLLVPPQAKIEGQTQYHHPAEPLEGGVVRTD